MSIDRFKKNTREQMGRAEHTIKKRLTSAITVMQDRVHSYESQQAVEMEKLQSGLLAIQSERAEQVSQFRSRFNELKSVTRGLIKRIKKNDEKYHTVMNLFFSSIASIQPIVADSETKRKI